MFLSICIPTYNRPEALRNCINSIFEQKNINWKNFEVCVSDNCSKENISKVLKPFKKKINIRYKRNKKNLGFAMNLLNVSMMAKGEFIWFLGDDDLVNQNSISYLINLIKKNKSIDFYFINSFYLKKSFLDNYPKPFNTKYLPKKMAAHSPQKKIKL